MEKHQYTKIKCDGCNYKWNTKSSKLYVTCPSCLRKVKQKNNYKTDSKQQDDKNYVSYSKCQKCNHEWFPRKEDPLVCPKCKSYDWEEDKGE